MGRQLTTLHHLPRIGPMIPLPSANSSANRDEQWSNCKWANLSSAKAKRREVSGILESSVGKCLQLRLFEVAGGLDC